MKKTTAEISLIMIVALWGLSFSLTKPLLSKIGVFNFLTYRFLIGGLILTVLLIAFKRFKLEKGVLKSGMLSGVLVFLAFYGHIEGLKHTSVAKNAFIVGASIVFIPLIIYIINKEKASRMTLIQTVIAISGLALITLVEISAINKGDIITLIGTFIYAIVTVLIEKAVRKYSVDVFTAIQLMTVGILSLVATLIFETPVIDFTVEEWGSIIFMAIVLTGFFYYMLNRIQSILSAANVTLIFTLEPFFATIFGWLILKEMAGMNVFVGGVLITISVVLPYVSKKRGLAYER